MKTLFKQLPLGIIIASFIIPIFLSAPQNAKADLVCKIKKAMFIPNGTQANDWFKDDPAPDVKIHVDTEYCEGKTLYFTMVEADTGLADITMLASYFNINSDNYLTSSKMDERPIVVPPTNSFDINMKAGEERCESGFGYDCDFFFLLKTPAPVQRYDSWAVIGGQLLYECDKLVWATGCDENWTFVDITQVGTVAPTAEHWYYKDLTTNPNRPWHGIYPNQGECEVAATTAGAQKSSCVKDGVGGEVIDNPIVDVPAKDGKYASNATFNPDYNLLAPIGSLKVIDHENTISDYLNIIFKIAIGLCGALAVLMIVLHGIQYMGDESVFGKTEAKSKIMASIFGLLVAIGSYALLNTISPALVGGSIDIQGVSITVAGMDKPQPEPASGKPYDGTNIKVGDDWPDDQADRDKITGLGFKIAGTKCKKVGKQYGGCTSVYKLNLSAINKLKADCPTCVINITGGTEFWLHIANSIKSHYPDGFVVDLQKTPTLSEYLHKIKPTPINWESGKPPANCYNSNGVGLVEESDHFHLISLTAKCVQQKP